jgi:hypothetical protein
MGCLIDIIPQIMIFEVNLIDIFNCMDYWMIFLCYLALILLPFSGKEVQTSAYNSNSYSTNGQQLLNSKEAE